MADFLEIAGFVTGVVGVWLTMKGNIWCFPVGLINVTLSLFLFYNHKLYSDAVQQGVYLLLLSYGWYQWSLGKTGNELPVRRLNLQTGLMLFIAGGIITTAMGYLFDRYTDADVPWLDATASAMSFIAQFLIARKILENWNIWMLVNVIYIGIYFYKEMYFYVVLFGIYLILSVYGFMNWRKILADERAAAQ